MRMADLSDRIIKLDRNIRFAGVVNSRGEVIEGGFQQGIKPLLDGSDEQQMYVQALTNVVTLQELSDRLGRFRYGITEHDKVILLTVPLSNGILCVSAASRVDAVKLRDKVLKEIRPRPRKSVARKR